MVQLLRYFVVDVQYLAMLAYSYYNWFDMNIMSRRPGGDKGEFSSIFQHSWVGSRPVTSFEL